MPPQAFLPGYFVYLLFIFLPGIGFGELLGVFKKIYVLSEKFALAFGLGLSIDTLVMLIRTSNLAGLVGIDLTTVYFTIAIGLLALLASLVLNKSKFSFVARPTSVDLALLLVILIQGGILLLYFQKYPIFPQYQSQDFGIHVNYVQGLISGSISSIPQGLLYFGVHYQLASSLLLVGGEPIITIQRTMALLVIMSPLLFYLAAKKIFSDSTAAGLIAALISTLSGTIWYVGVLNAGLYPNFFGILAVLFLLIALAFLSTNIRSIRYWIFFILALANTYMSHYTAVTVLPALLLLPLLKFSIMRKSDAKDYLYLAVVAVIPAVIPFVLYPKLASYILFLASSGGGIISGSTYLSNGLSFFPVLQYLAVVVFDDVELVFLSLLALVYLYYVVKLRNNALSFIPLVWIVSLIVAAPLNVSAWRYSYEVLVPLTLMASYAMAAILSPSNFLKQSKLASQRTIGAKIKGGDKRSPVLSIILILVIFGALLAGSYAQSVVVNSLADTRISSQTQNYIYTSMYWLKDNTPNNSQYLSVSDSRFIYTDTIIGRTTIDVYILFPDSAIALAKNYSAQYIIVTNITDTNTPSTLGLSAWNNFPASSNSNLILLYTNPDVRVYEVANNP